MGNLHLDSIAKGWLEMMEDRDLYHDENNMTILAFGMIPSNHFNMLMEGIFNKVSQEMTKEGQVCEGIKWQSVKSCLKEDFKTKMRQDMTLAILKNTHTVA